MLPLLDITVLISCNLRKETLLLSNSDILSDWCGCLLNSNIRFFTIFLSFFSICQPFTTIDNNIVKNIYSILRKLISILIFLVNVKVVFSCRMLSRTLYFCLSHIFLAANFSVNFSGIYSLLVLFLLRCLILFILLYLFVLTINPVWPTKRFPELYHQSHQHLNNVIGKS